MKKLITTMAILAVVLFTGCKKDDYVEIVGVCPLVISTDPANGAISVPYNKVITAKFNEKMDPATITESSFTLQQGTTGITGTVTFHDSTATFTPKTPLAIFGTFKATIKNTAKDLMGNALQKDYVWTFTTMPQISLISNPILGGTTVGGGAFAVGASVTVTATPLPGYTFVNWTENGVVVSLINSPLQINASQTSTNGTEVSSSSSYTFTMTGNRVLTANFAVIVLGNFAINLSSNPAAGGSTSGGGSYVENSSKTVTATANTGYTFMNWTEGGLIVSTNASYNFTLIANKTLVANFLINSYSLTTNAVNGSVGKSPIQASYNFGSSVVLTPTANSGYSFTSWSGDASGTSNPLSVIMDANKSITANFTLNSYSLTVISNNGSVLKVPSQTAYNHGSTVQLTATPNFGYTFTSWSGDASGSSNPLTVTMTSNKNITANYTAIIGTLTLNITAVNGTVTKNPNLAGYLAGASVLLTATPNSGYEFTSWSGDATGSVNPTTIIMNSNKNVIANFTLTVVPGTITLGMAERFGILAGVGIANDAGFSTIDGLDVGIYPGVRSSITGFGPAVVTGGGALYASDDNATVSAMLLQAQTDLTKAYNDAAGATLPAPQLAPADLGGKTLAPGIYYSTSSLLLQNGNLTLDAGGDVNAVWIFKVGSAFTSVGSSPYPSAGGSIILAGGAKAKNVFWQVSSSATIGDYTSFKGNVLALSDITMAPYSQAEGRMLARNGTVKLNSTNKITKPLN